MEAPCRQVREVKTPGQGRQRSAPTFCDFYLQELNQILLVNIKEKSPCDSGKGKGKRTILKYTREFCFPKQGLLSRETILPELILLGFYEDLSDQGKGNT